MVMSPIYEGSRLYRYQFDLSDGCGHIIGSNEEIFVFRDCSPLHYNAISIEHVNSLKCFFDNPTDHHLVCAIPGTPLKSHLAEWKEKEKNAIIMKFKLPYFSSQGDIRYDGIEVSYLHSDITGIVRQMFEFVNDLHLMKFTMNAIKLENLWIKGKTVQFGGIEYVPFGPGVTHHREKMDFLNLVNAIKELLGHGFSVFPPVSHLLSLTQNVNYKMPGHRRQLTSHLSLLTPAEVIQFIYHCGERIGHNTGNDTYKDVMAKVTRPDKWKSNFSGHKFSSIQKCFLKGTYVQTGNAHEVKCSLLRFTRDLVSHMDARSNLGLSKEQLIATIMSLFGTTLMDTHTSLADRVILNDFMSSGSRS